MVARIGKVGIGLAVPVGVYAVVLGALLTPYLQRFALYANKFNTLFVRDVDDAEPFGFAKNQVTPFYITTPDGETLYAWHILPIDVYTQNEAILRAEKRDGLVEDFTKTTAFRLLTTSDPPARVVVSFHGNAGHVAQGWRPDTYRYAATHRNTHVLAIDYRGFGKSSGSPSEEGLIVDGKALVDFALHVANIPPERIVILGQSLGTAVASGVALRFADPGASARLLSQGTGIDAVTLLDKKAEGEPKTFASVILVAPFYDIPSLLLTYRIGGWLPLLLPLRPFPWLARRLTAQMVDKWRTGERLAAYYSALADSPALVGEGGRKMGSLQIFHAVNDRDISYHQTEMICARVFEGREKCIDGRDGAALLDVRREGRVRVRFEILEFGGHNRIITYSPIAAALVRAFDDVGP